MIDKIDRDELNKCRFHEFKKFEELDPKNKKTTKFNGVELTCYLAEHNGGWNDNLYAVVKAKVAGKPCFVTIQNEWDLFTCRATYIINEPSVVPVLRLFTDKLPLEIREKFPLLNASITYGSKTYEGYKGLENPNRFGPDWKDMSIYICTPYHNSCPLKEGGLYKEQCELILYYMSYVSQIEQECVNFSNTKLYAILRRKLKDERKRRMEERKKHETERTLVTLGILAWKVYRLANGFGGNEGGADANIDFNTLDFSQIDISNLDGNLELSDYLASPVDDNFLTALDGGNVSDMSSVTIPPTGDVSNVVPGINDISNQTNVGTNTDAGSALNPTPFDSGMPISDSIGKVSYNTQPDGTVIVTDIFGGQHHYMSMEQASACTDFVSGMPSNQFSSMPSASTTSNTNDNYNPRDDYSARPFEDSKHDQIVFDEQKRLQEDAVSKYKDAISNGNVEEAGKWEKIALDAERSKQAHSKFYPTYGLDDRTLAGLDS